MKTSTRKTDFSPVFASVGRSVIALCVICVAQLSMAQLSSAPQMQSEELRITYIRPDVDLRDYNQFVLKSLDLEDTRIIPPPWAEGEDADPRTWQLSDGNREFLKAAFQSAMGSGLEESGEFNVVDQAFRGSLQLEIKLVSLAPYARRGEQVTTKGYGELAFEAALRDARSGELLALFEGTQQVGKEYQENTDFNKGHNFASLFRQWGRNVSERMSAVHEMK
ncbi:MAG: DUF3313 family protein [Cellvibrionaceae bacterium]